VTLASAQYCCNKCRHRIIPESVSFLGGRVYPGFVMVFLSAMQSGVTDNLINDIRMSHGVARPTLQRWRRWWREIFVGTPFWFLGRGRFMPLIEHTALPMTLLNRFKGQGIVNRSWCCACGSLLHFQGQA
jgi:hypothetical protein